MASEYFWCELSHSQRGISDRNPPRGLFENDDEVVPTVFGPVGDGG